jgi:4-carboxymuconolactone decarboxylase
MNSMAQRSLATSDSGGLANHSNEEDMERREAGEKIIREMMGDETAERLLASAGSGTFGSAVAGYAIDQAFGEIWIRPGLDRMARSLVSMAVMIALRQPHEFAIHMNIGLNNGLTLAEIEEALIQTLPYVGFPAVATALVAAGKVIQERRLDKNPPMAATGASFDQKYRCRLNVLLARLPDRPNSPSYQPAHGASVW